MYVLNMYYIHIDISNAFMHNTYVHTHDYLYYTALQVIELPLLNPELFQRVGITPPKGCLLYGPPGTGKTLLARAVASQLDANFLKVVSSAIVDKYIGESARLIREMFGKHTNLLVMISKFYSSTYVRMLNTSVDIICTVYIICIIIIIIIIIIIWCLILYNSLCQGSSALCSVYG